LKLQNSIFAALFAFLFFASSGWAAVQAQTPGKPARFVTAESSIGNYLAALVAGAKRDTNASSVYWREALRADPRNLEIMERAFISTLADGNTGEALRLAERLISRDRKNALAHVLIGTRHLKNRQFVAARESFAKAGGGRGRNADLTANLLSAWAHVGGGELNKALELVDRSAKDKSLASYRNFLSGLMAEISGNRAEAEKRLKAANALEPSIIRVADAYGRLLARVGRNDEALAVYNKVGDQNARAPGAVDPLVQEPVGLIKSGKIPDPLVNSVTEGAAEVFYGLGTLGSRSGDEIAALIYLQLASYLDPRNEIVALTLAEVFEQVEQYERASQAYARVPEGSPLKSRAVIRNAVSLEKLERSDEGLEGLRGQISRNPDDLDVVDTLASFLRQKKKWVESAEVYDGAIKRIAEPGRQHWNLFYGRGIAHERSKQWPKAEADFKKALTLLPENPVERQDKRDRAQVLNYLGYSWVDMGINVDEAFPMLKKAVELSPEDGYIVDSLGWAHYRLGFYDDAVRELERAIELRPNDSTINDHLGDAYWKVGRKLEAKFQWNHARDMKPEPEELEKILKKISDGPEDAAKPNTAVKPSTANETAAPEAEKKNGG
jgi:tetratricopeptide (TPR) repeat protein